VQRAILEVKWGPLHGRKAIIAPGEKIRVGRKERANLIVAKDAKMSGVHFELAWDGSTCKVRDLKSATGTFLGGTPVTDSVVVNGAWIRAGETDFSVHFERATPPPAPPLLDDPEDDEDYPPIIQKVRVEKREERRREAAELMTRKQAALKDLRAVSEDAASRKERLYAVLDAARSDRILVLLRESVETYRSLYEGVDGEVMSPAAPYLAELPRGSALLEHLVMEGWEGRWGIFFTCPRPFRDARRHLRHFLMVRDDDTRKRLYFRFYDPGVLREFLPLSTVRQRAEFFGEVTAFYAESERGALLKFERGTGASDADD
jgi:pSer/pThr/pTyr-binding forkhead associated (FHA) protein